MLLILQDEKMQSHLRFLELVSLMFQTSISAITSDVIIELYELIGLTTAQKTTTDIKVSKLALYLNR